MTEDSKLTAISPLIKEYEAVIKALNSQNDYYKVEHTSLRKQIVDLIEENQQLSEKLKQRLSPDDDDKKEPPYRESELVNSLKSQLEFSLTEKESAVKLWKTSLQTVERLEDELRQVYMHGKSDVAESEIVRLNSELKETRLKMGKALEERSNELEKALKNQRTLLSQVESTKKEVEELKEELNDVATMRNKLEDALEERTKHIAALQTQDADSKRRVLEAVQVAESALMEKEAAVCHERNAKEEVLKMSKTLSEIIDEAGTKVKNEVENIKQQYNDKLKLVLADMKKIKDELADKSAELERTKRECKLLEEQMGRLRKGSDMIDDTHTSKLLSFEKNLESTFQKLLLSERRNLQVTAERDALKLDIEQMSMNFEQDIKTKELEKHALENRVKSLQNELNISNQNLLKVSKRVQQLNEQLETFQTDVRRTFEKNQEMHEELLKEKIGKMQDSNTKVQKELEQYLESQIKINKKWKEEVPIITKKLVRRIKELKAQISDLQRENTSLRQQMEVAMANVEHQENLEM